MSVPTIEELVRDMKLPQGKTCSDCRHYQFCKRFFGCPPTNTECDWAPSRFYPAAALKGLDDART